MSEYQYYEFLAIDRPLDDEEQAEVRSLSTRARITATSFVNEYHWGDFKGDPNRLMERYYDAHLYVANWGTHRVMFRLPCELLDPEVVENYCAADQASAGTWKMDVVLFQQRVINRHRLVPAGNQVAEHVGNHQRHQNLIVLRQLKDNEDGGHRGADDPGKQRAHSYERVGPWLAGWKGSKVVDQHTNRASQHGP